MRSENFSFFINTYIQKFLNPRIETVINPRST